MTKESKAALMVAYSHLWNMGVSPLRGHGSLAEHLVQGRYGYTVDTIGGCFDEVWDDDGPVMEPDGLMAVNLRITVGPKTGTIRLSGAELELARAVIKGTTYNELRTIVEKALPAETARFIRHRVSAKAADDMGIPNPDASWWRRLWRAVAF